MATRRPYFSIIENSCGSQSKNISTAPRMFSTHNEFLLLFFFSFFSKNIPVLTHYITFIISIGLHRFPFQLCGEPNGPIISTFFCVFHSLNREFEKKKKKKKKTRKKKKKKKKKKV